MNFRLPQVELRVVSFTQRIADVEDTLLQLEGHTTTEPNIGVIESDDLVFKVRPTRIHEPEEIGIQVNQVTVLDTCHCKTVGINALFVKAPQQAVATQLEHFIAEIVRRLQPTSLYAHF